MTFGRATVIFSERCEAALTVEVDPVGLVRARSAEQARQRFETTTDTNDPRQ